MKKEVIVRYADGTTRLPGRRVKPRGILRRLRAFLREAKTRMYGIRF